MTLIPRPEARRAPAARHLRHVFELIRDIRVHRAGGFGTPILAMPAGVVNSARAAR